MRRVALFASELRGYIPFISPTLSLSYLVLRLHDSRFFTDIFQLAICSLFLFRPSQLLENVYILLMYTHTYSEFYPKIPAPSTSEASYNVSVSSISFLVPLVSCLN